MMLQAVEHGFIDDVSEVLETFIGEAKPKAILVAEIIVDDLDGAILEKHADGRVGDGIHGLARQSGSLPQSIDAACRRQV
jgi:hypothetical protein